MIYLLLAPAVLVAAILIVIVINPGPRANNSANTWLKNIPVAHRGLHSQEDNIPENSLEAFRRARDAGYGIELDVLLTADGVPVIFHDYCLKRMTGLDRKVADTPWSEVSKLNLLDSRQGIPRLKDVLELVKGKVPLLIEIKNEGSVGPLEQAVLEELAGYSGQYSVQGFNPFVLKYFHDNAPEVVRGQISGSFKGEKLAWWKKFLLRWLLLNGVSKPQYVAYETGAMPRWLASRLRAKGLYVLTWTVNCPGDYVRDMRYADNIIFEDLTPEITK